MTEDEEMDQVPLAPLPTQVQFKTATLTTGERYVIMEFTTPQGSNAFWVEPEMFAEIVQAARQVLTDVQMAAKLAVVQSRLVVPGR